MAIIPSNEYPGQTNAPNAAYPQGSARDVSVPGAGDGTPWRATLVNDLFGFLQGLLADAGITPSGTPDTATDSQYVEAVNTLITDAINALNLAQQITDGAETVFDDKVAAPDAALASLIDQRAGSVFDAEVAAPDASLVALIDSRVNDLDLSGYDQYYDGTSQSLTDYPVGSIVAVANEGSTVPGRNSTVNIFLNDNASEFTDSSSSGGSALSGTWRARGGYGGNNAQDFFLAQRVA